MSAKFEKIYCDGAFNKQTTPNGWASVVAENKQDIIGLHSDKFAQYLVKLQIDATKVKIEKKNMFQKQSNTIRSVVISHFDDCKMQNNGAELIAMVFAMYYAVYIKPLNSNALDMKKIIVCSDSQLLIDHWSKKLGQDKIAGMDPHKYQLILELQRLRKLFEAQGHKLLKISGDDNLADLGAHK